MKPIYYLSYSDNPQKMGLVFPAELQKETYSPGIWVIDLPRSQKRIPDALEFDVVDSNQLQELKMIRVDNSVFQVDTLKYGKFYFRIMHMSYHYDRYVGNSTLIDSKSRLYQVVPLDFQKLERVCLQNGFFFVGRVDSLL